MKRVDAQLPIRMKNSLAKQRIRHKAEHRAQAFNESHETMKFKVGETVLLNPVGRSEDNTSAKIFRLFNGLYKFRAQGILAVTLYSFL